MRKFRIIIYAVLLILFFLLQFSFFSKRTQSFNFSDENEHLTPAFMMIRENKSLYQDLSTNHQPLPILTAYAFYKAIPIPNLFMLIERVRQSLFFLSFIGAVILTLRFGIKGLAASILIELIKFYFFGYYLLAEALVVYPLMYIAGILFESVFFNIKKTKNILLTIIDSCVFALSTFWIAFNLLPTWPFLILSSIFFFRNKTIQKISLKWFIVFLIVPTILLFILINPLSWFQETIINNYKYFLPLEKTLSDKSILHLIFYPFLSISTLHQPIARHYALLLFLGLFSISFFISNKKSLKKTSRYFLIFYSLLILLNLRVTTLDVGFYTAFHLLPQAAFLTMLVICILFLSFKKRSGQEVKGRDFAIIVLFSIVLLANGTKWWRESVFIDKLNEHFINYGEDESIGMALNVIKKDSDRLLAGPQSGFINIFADLPLATRQTAYLDWAYRSPTLRNEFNSILQKSPPTFVYFPESNNPYYLALKPILETRYKRIQRSFGGNTNLYILSSEIEKRTPEQWRKFSDLFYQPPID